MAEIELADLQTHDQVLKDLQKELVESRSSLNTIVSQLAGLADFWTVVSGMYHNFQDDRGLTLPSTQD